MFKHEKQLFHPVAVEKPNLYLCTGLTKGETAFDDNEAIDIEEYDIDDLYEMVMNGQIEDGKSQVAILMVKGLLAEGKFQEYLNRSGLSDKTES